MRWQGELHIVEYGRNDVLGTCRTEHMNPYLISAVVQEARGIAPVRRAAAANTSACYLASACAHTLLRQQTPTVQGTVQLKGSSLTSAQ